MNIISYRYTNTFKQFLLIVCMLYFILCAVVIAEVTIFNVPGYEMGTLGVAANLLFYMVIFAVLILFFIGYKFCYTLYDDETIIYYNKLLRRERSIDIASINKVVLNKKGVNIYANGDLDNSAFYIPFFRGGIIEAIEIDMFYRKMKEIEGIEVVKEFKVLPGYGKGFTALKVAYVFLTAYMLLLCATPLATVIVLYQHFAQEIRYENSGKFSKIIRYG